ncbi:MAG TPA: LemA family protein, partial [Burkholderiaceae bacterium]|nr:LemA family protein [Burkholderiaceae bacterium]
GTENRIATERGRYVKAVQEYNVYIRQFPTLITAKIFGYDVKPNYGVNREAEIRRDPEVNFTLPASAGK